MQESKTILGELEKLIALKEIEIDKIDTIKNDFKYEPIRYMLLNLQIGAKPEDATSKLLHSVFNDILNIKEKIFTEVKLVSSGFADFRIQENKVNPTQVELKPLFKRNQKKLTLNKFKYQPHKDQVQKYLKENEYLILTNLDTTYLFNRDAILDYEPFYELKFIDLLTQFLTIDNLWDTVRRLDDKKIKPELESDFFTDLKKWYKHFDTVAFDLKDGFSKEELIVLFLNKIIFIKTLEDYGLIPYKYLEDRYLLKEKDWCTKGVKAIFNNFFYEMEDWFYAFYDTELFTVNVWDYIKKDVMTYDNETEPNLEHFQQVFEKILGFRTWEYTMGKGLIHYNYRKIDEDIFGKAYETFIAESRKDGGIFYTPKTITLYMVEKTVQQLFEPFINKIIEAIKKEEIEKAKLLFTEMQKIKIIDPSSGSGSFLIKVLREIYSYYMKLDEPTKWVKNFKQEDIFSNIPKIVTETKKFRKFIYLEKKTDLRILLAHIILNHIFALDIDERAIETAKTNLWKEAIKLEPSIFNYHKLPKTANHILPNLQMNFLSADALYDISIETQIEIISKEHKYEIIELYRIRNEYIANHNQPELLDPVKELKEKIRNRLIDEIAGFKLNSEGFEKLKVEGVPDSILKKLKSLKEQEFVSKSDLLITIDALLKEKNNPIYDKLFVKHAERINILAKPTFIVSEFYFNYFDTEGNPLPESERGFDAVISNPPWEEIYPVKKEFYNSHFESVGKFQYDAAEFEDVFKQKLKNKNFAKKWNNYTAFYSKYTEFIVNTYKYHNKKPATSKAMRSHLNYFKVFVERDLELVKENAYVNILIPSSFQTDEGGFGLRELALYKYKFSELLSFENKGYYEKENDKNKVKLFPDVHPQFKISIVNIQKSTPKNNENFESLFYLLHPNDLYEKERLSYNVEMIKEFSPDALSIMEFKTKKDYQLCTRIKAKHKVLSQHSYKIRREFNVTDDNKLFSYEKNKKNNAIIFEGKMIHQYNSNHNNERYYTDFEIAKDNLFEKEIKRIKRALSLNIKNEELKKHFEEKKYKSEFENYRLIYRAIGRSTDERTLISSIIPKDSFSVNSVNYLINNYYESDKKGFFIQKKHTTSDVIYIMSLFNSLTLNYYIRNKISANLNMFYIYELPIPKASKKVKQILVEKSFQLLYANSKKGQFEDLAEELNIKPREIDAIRERAEIELIISRELFGLSLDEWKYLTSTFIYGKSDSKIELDGIISKSIEKYGDKL